MHREEGEGGMDGWSNGCLDECTGTIRSLGKDREERGSKRE